MSENFPLYPSMKIGISDLRVFAAFDTVFAGDDFKISTDMHIHAYYEIIAVVSGAMRMDFTGRASEIMEADSVCLIPPGVYHCSGLVGDVPCGSRSAERLLTPSLLRFMTPARKCSR